MPGFSNSFAFAESPRKIFYFLTRRSGSNQNQARKTQLGCLSIITPDEVSGASWACAQQFTRQVPFCQFRAEQP